MSTRTSTTFAQNSSLQSHADKYFNKITQPPWLLSDICEELAELASKLSVSFSLIKHSANKAAAGLAKRGVGREKLVVEIGFRGLLHPFGFLL